MTDLHRFAKDSKISVWNDLQSWTFQPALTLNQALLGIIPPSSVNVLPTSLQPLLQRNAEHELFKEDFKVDLEGKQQDYEAVLLLPIVDYKTLKMMCKDTSSPGTVLTY
jgi:5'-3' exonuclease